MKKLSISIYSKYTPYDFFRFVGMSAVCIAMFFSMLPAFAQGAPAEEAFKIEGQPDYNNEGVNKQTSAFTGERGAGFGRVRDPREAVALGIQSVLVLLGTLFLAYAVYAGYLILTSAGNEERVDKGKHILKNTTIGIAIVLSAYSMTWIVQRMFVASGDDAYKECYPPGYEEFIDDPLSPHNTDSQYKNC